MSAVPAGAATASAEAPSALTARLGGADRVGIHARVEHLLSARLYLSPQIAGDRLFFISDLSGRLSLYAMDRRGSVPEPLLPPDVALMTPELLGGESFVAVPEHGRRRMIDRDGDEAFTQPFRSMAVIPSPCSAAVRRPAGRAGRARPGRRRDDLGRPEGPPRTGGIRDPSGPDGGAARPSQYGNDVMGHSRDRPRYLLVDGYTEGD